MFTYPLPAAVIAGTAADALKYSFAPDGARDYAKVVVVLGEVDQDDIPGLIKAAIEGAADAVESWLDDETFDLATTYENNGGDEDYDYRDAVDAISATVWGPSVRLAVPPAVKALFGAEHHAMIDKMVDEYVIEEEERPARELAELAGATLDEQRELCKKSVDALNAYWAAKNTRAKAIMALHDAARKRRG
jgi:hypothetical protein